MPPRLLFFFFPFPRAASTSLVLSAVSACQCRAGSFYRDDRTEFVLFCSSSANVRHAQTQAGTHASGRAGKAHEERLRPLRSSFRSGSNGPDLKKERNSPGPDGVGGQLQHCNTGSRSSHSQVVDQVTRERRHTPSAAHVARKPSDITSLSGSKTVGLPRMVALCVCVC